jgi:CheY-like chemotaxis protein
VVDDYLPNQDVVKMHLEGSGYEVELASNGKLALDHCANKKFNLILMDIQMPEMDGYETTRILRQRGGWLQEIPILGLTANADEQTIRQCLSIGMNGVMTKPIRRESFLSEIKRWLGGSGIASKASEGRASVEKAPVPEILAPAVPSTPVASQGQAPEVSAAAALPLNYDEAIREFGGNRGLLDNVVKSFLLQAARQMTAIKEALDKKDLPAIGREAHKVRGAAGNLTAMELSGIAKTMEEQAKRGEAEGLETLAAKLLKEFERLKAFVAKGYKE